MDLSPPTQAIIKVALEEELCSLQDHLSCLRAQLKTPFNSAKESPEDRIVMSNLPSFVRQRIRQLEHIIEDPSSDISELTFIIDQWRQRLLWLPDDQSIKVLTQQCETALSELKEKV